MVLGQKPLLDQVVQNLIDNEVEISNVLEITSETVSRFNFAALQNLLKGKEGYLVLAVEQPHKLYMNAMLLDRFDYIFTSFSLALALGVKEDPKRKYDERPDWWRRPSVV